MDERLSALKRELLQARRQTRWALALAGAALFDVAGRTA